MKVTALSTQQRDPHRINVMVDGKYRLSLDIAQISELGIKIGNEYTDNQLIEFEAESQFGKLYAKALEYSLLRPHSSKEMRDYLYRKTLTRTVRSKRTGKITERLGVPRQIAERVYDRLYEKGHIDDEKFAKYWVENRSLKKGASRRKLYAELMAKGVERTTIEEALGHADRYDVDEIKKILVKKKHRYDDEQKLVAYLVRQGFTYDSIREALAES